MLQISCFFRFFAAKTLKMVISTSVWSAWHPNAGQNIQHTLFYSSQRCTNYPLIFPWWLSKDGCFRAECPTASGFSFQFFFQKLLIQKWVLLYNKTCLNRCQGCARVLLLYMSPLLPKRMTQRFVCTLYHDTLGDPLG